MTSHQEGDDVRRPSRNLVFCGARIAIDPWHTIRAALLIRQGNVQAILPDDSSPLPSSCDTIVIHARDHIILPGLINSHDHLHLGGFPRLGRGPYLSWREWARDIYKPDEAPLNSLIQIPKKDRLWSGIVRNILAGVTTVCHHDAPHWMLTSAALPITIYSSFGWAHSLDDSEWTERYALTRDPLPFMVHCAEGLDSRSRREVTKLERRSALGDRLVLIHAVGVSQRDWGKLRSAGVWIVWCPTSNQHILGRTLSRDLVLSYPSIILGSDSPISSCGDLLDEIKAARTLYDIPPELLYRMTTTRPARMLRLSPHYGAIAPGSPAHLLIIRDNGLPPCEALATLGRQDIAAVLHSGRLVAASRDFLHLHSGAASIRLSRIEQDGSLSYVAAPPHSLPLAHLSSSSPPPSAALN